MFSLHGIVARAIYDAPQLAGVRCYKIQKGYLYQVPVGLISSCGERHRVRMRPNNVRKHKTWCIMKRVAMFLFLLGICWAQWSGEARVPPVRRDGLVRPHR